MKISIQQQAGLGDILFLYKAAYELTLAGHEVHWSIGSFWWWVAERNINKKIFFYREDDLDHRSWCDFNINLQYMQINCIESIMSGKYDEINRVCSSCGLDISLSYNSWQNYLPLLCRNYDKEDELFQRLCAGKKDYALVCRKWSSGEFSVESFNFIQKPIVWFDQIENYTLYDWLKIYKNASEVHSVDTSAMHMFDAFDTNASQMCAYARDGIKSKLCLNHIMSNKKWLWNI